MEKKKKITLIVGTSVTGVGLLTVWLLRRRKKVKQLQAGTPALPSKQTGTKKTYDYSGSTFPSRMVRGFRNNNPGNIIRTKTLWQGEIPHSENTDARFKQFQTYRDGVRAIVVNLKAYHKKGYRTIRQIISRWAPPSENKTAPYIAHVSKHSGIPPDMPLMWEKETIRKITEGIIKHENGKLYLNPGDYDWAWLTA